MTRALWLIKLWIGIDRIGDGGGSVRQVETVPGRRRRRTRWRLTCGGHLTHRERRGQGRAGGLLGCCAKRKSRRRLGQGEKEDGLKEKEMTQRKKRFGPKDFPKFEKAFEFQKRD